MTAADHAPNVATGDRDALGRRVREVWVSWARQQDDPKPSWLVGWDDLPEPDREVDRRIGAALWGDGFAAGLDALPSPATDGLREAAFLTAAELGRFWSQVNKTPTCWLWIGYVGPTGYGRFSFTRSKKSKTHQAHRISYRLAGREIPDGLVLDHICRVRNCVNPEHLRPLTNRENVLIGIGPTALNSRRDSCSQGHPYTPETLYVYPDGTRRCRICHNRGNARKFTCDICGQERGVAHRNRHLQSHERGTL